MKSPGKRSGLIHRQIREFEQRRRPYLFKRFPPKTYREKVWDQAAGAIIVSESGGVISDAAGVPLEFGKGRFLDINGGIVASSTPELHEQLLKAIADLR